MAKPAKPATTNGCKATETSGGADKAEGAPIATNKLPSALDRMAMAGNAGAVALSSGRADPIKTNKMDNARPAKGPAMAVSNSELLVGAYSLSSLS